MLDGRSAHRRAFQDTRAATLRPVSLAKSAACRNPARRARRWWNVPLGHTLGGHIVKGAKVRRILDLLRFRVPTR